MKRRIVPLLAAVVVAGLGAAGWWVYENHWVPPDLRSSPTHKVLLGDFDRAHRERHEGQVRVVVPEVYELMNVVVALTDASLNNPYRFANHGTPYYDEVMTHFAPYSDHAVIDEIDASLHRYPSHRAIFGYDFRGDRIVPGGPYAGTWRDGVFRDYLPLLEDFARKSGFREFYAAHRPCYEEQIREYASMVPLETIWRWLEEEFPARYDAYTVVISPLVRGTHNTFCYQARTAPLYREIVMFVSGPDATDAAGADPAVRAAVTTRFVFTEIDHNYVNPVTDKEDHLDRIDLAMRELDGWNTGSGYGSPALTFNEYMTWAAFILFARDRYPGDVFSETKRRTIRLMEEWRGFIRFEEFAAALLRIADRRGDEVTVARLYPDILQWMDSQRQL